MNRGIRLLSALHELGAILLLRPWFADLRTFAVEMLTMELSGIHAGQTIDIYCNGGRPIGHLAVGKALDTAGAAKKMAYHFMVEEILGECAFSGFQLKFFQWCKCQHKTHALAARTIASDRVAKVNIHFIAHGSALAATVVMCKFHDFIPFEVFCQSSIAKTKFIHIQPVGTCQPERVFSYTFPM
jgi:hypothetical protein